jgi:hypothetical protein
MKVARVVTAVAAAAGLAVVAAPTANAYQLCESDTPGWTACIETQADGLWHARGWGNIAAWVSLWKGSTLQQTVYVPPGGGGLTTAGASGSTQACVGPNASPSGPFFSCVSHIV